MSASGTFRAIREVGGTLAQSLVGAAFMGGGGFVTWTALQKEPHDKMVLYIGLGAALFGALIFPSIFPIAKQIIVVIFPNGIPLLGGKRSSDPPAPPSP